MSLRPSIGSKTDVNTCPPVQKHVYLTNVHITRIKTTGSHLGNTQIQSQGSYGNVISSDVCKIRLRSHFYYTKCIAMLNHLPVSVDILHC